MKNLLLSVSLAVCFGGSVEALDITGLEQIGPIARYDQHRTDVVFTCSDNSQVQLSILAPDLVRVRASFLKALPERDHSWAIDKTNWDAPRWKVTENADHFLITTDELEIVVHRAPLIIEFRDAKTHQVINADARPMMYDSKSSMVAAAKKLGFDEHFYGLGEKAWQLDKRRGQFTMWNSDTPGYREGTDPIYQSIPFYIGWQRGEAYGIFFDNSYRTRFDFGVDSQEHIAFAADGGEMNYYFFNGPSMKKIIGRYTELTGRIPLPPLWALGNQQSRWSYYPESTVEELVRQYRERDIPLDAVHLDIHYMNGYRVFTWNTDRFPDPTAMMSKLKQQGIKIVTIVDPGVKYQPTTETASDAKANPELAPQDKSYHAYNEGIAKDYFLKRKDGSPYIGRVWPGESRFVDFTLPDARKWWGDLHKALFDHGVAGIWNDMNEPADFVDQSGKSQMDVVSHDLGENSPHAKNRNVFALLMARATYEGFERLRPNDRPFIITRAGYAGIQRYSTMWTGDNSSSWDDLALTIPMFTTLGLSGESFVGADIGGFNGKANGELLTRWYQVGFLTPLCRNHKVIDGYDQEPWRFGQYYEGIIRKYLKLRYRLLPFLYTTLEEARRTGVPVFRPLLLNYQSDANTLNINDEFMIGEDLLAAPILHANQTNRLVYLPDGMWFDYWTGKQYAGGATIRVEAPLEITPLFVRVGAIIPMWPEMNYISEKPVDQVTFEVYPSEKGDSTMTLYEDDGASPAYKQGVFRRTRISTTKTNGDYEINISAPEGSYQPTVRSFVFVVKSVSAKQVLVDGKALSQIKEDEKGNGWFKTADSSSIRIADDAKAHMVRIQ